MTALNVLCHGTRAGGRGDPPLCHKDRASSGVAVGSSFLRDTP